jgi:NAD(P)-dependent dehydrogenase (short-subunit alcohol dehydrogenase family)
LQRVRNGRFDGETVLITGGSRGLGLLLAREFARRGAQLVICSRDVSELEAARRELAERFGAAVLARRCDVTDRAQVEALVQEATSRFGGVDVLVNNAGIIQIGPVAVMSERDFRASVDVNLWGMIYATRAVLPQMRARGRGRIVDITSIGGVVAVPHLMPYSVAKFGTVGFSTGMGAELDREGIRVTTVVPGLMRTGSFLHALAKGQREKEVQWFSLGASLPFISMDAERAARRMVDACARGQRWITVGLPAKILRLGAALAPGTTIALLARVSAILPSSAGVGREQKAEPGWKNRTGLARSFLTRLGERAALHNNEILRPRQ